MNLLHKSLQDGASPERGDRVPRPSEARAVGRDPNAWSLSAGDGRFEIRLTRDPKDIEASQALRYHVFYEEMDARPDAEMARLRRDADAFDAICDHLLVLDHKRPEGDRVVGTYRLLRRAVAESHAGFYSASEYDIAPLLDAVPASEGGLMELGRSCVLAEYRTNATIQMLWRGLSYYVFDHGIRLMFGCASMPGRDPARLAVPLSYLYHHHLAPPELRAVALPHLYTRMDLIPAEEVVPRRALHELPPLVKAYLRLGCYIGDGAVVDQQFGTTDVCIILPIERVAPKYYAHFDREELDARSADDAGSADKA
ncbi:GNAT family N-acetyltransferase [Marinibaculum pumilum]|uniref:L-ornithine N(alpha)-acyltransferase n=1 Tax=Marinibaculum pumilum TaxID=1766165 RepID=A0ABV7KUU6_9PROT